MDQKNGVAPDRATKTPKLVLDYKRTFMIGFGFLASSLAWALYNSFIPLMLRDRYLLSSAVIGTIMTIDNFFGIIFQPAVGVLSDKTNSRLGKRMPWIMVGLPICAILFGFIPHTTTVTTMMIVLIAFNLIMSLWRSPVIALMPDVTPKPLRSKANGIINLMGGLGSIVAFLVGGRLADMNDRTTLPFLMGSIVMVVSLFTLLIFVREPAGLRYRRERNEKMSSRSRETLDYYDALEAQEAALEAENEYGEESKKSVKSFLSLSRGEKVSLVAMLIAIFFWFAGFNAVETFFTSYATSELGLSDGAATQMLTAFSLAFLVFALPSGILAEKFGRKRMIVGGLIGIIVMFVPMLFIQDVTILLLLLIGGGLFWACININSLPMVVELATKESVGSFTGYYYFFSFGAAIASPILFGWVHDLTQDYSVLFVYSVIAFIIALISMIFVKHGDNLVLAKHNESAE